MSVAKIVSAAVLVCGAIVAQPMAALETPTEIGRAVFSSDDLKSYYMGADIGNAFKGSEYRAKTKLGAVAKAPFVAVWQLVKGLARVPGATIANAKADPVEAIVQGLALAAAVGSQTDWFGLDDSGSGSDKKGLTEPQPLPLPPEGQSLAQFNITRHQCAGTTSSSRHVIANATFGESGSSACAISIGDAPEPPE